MISNAARIRASLSGSLRQVVRRQETEVVEDNNDVMSRVAMLPANKRFRGKILLFIEHPESSAPALWFSVYILFLIVSSIVVFLLEREKHVAWIREIDGNVWFGIEILCSVTFTAEYLARVAVRNVLGDVQAWRFLLKPEMLCDALAIVPFYADLVAGETAGTSVFKVLRVFRLVRLLRVFRLGRFAWGMRLMTVAVQKSFQALWILIFWLAVGTLWFSSALYYFEKLACPPYDDLEPGYFFGHSERCSASSDGFDTAPPYYLCCDSHGSPLDLLSISGAFWWSMVTMCTVGFGDARPRTKQGYVVGSASMMCGILLIALPVAIVSSKFQETYQTMEEPGEQAHKRQTKKKPNPGDSSLGNGDFDVMARAAAEQEKKSATQSLQKRLARVPMTTEQVNVIQNLVHMMENLHEMEMEMRTMTAKEETRSRQIQEQFASVLGLVRQAVSSKSKCARAPRT
mmetsp:Transcript_22432/g.49010  ORF Transcript_22432/g.49010 Transcript_22432/m.49010 type:complete len:458 (-) Transcript_22432:40-1413(-)